MTQSPRPARPRELQDALNYHIYHPLAWRIALRLADTSVTPNIVSVAGMVCIMLAALAYAQPGWPLPALLGLALHMGWHVLDGADGDLARLTKRASTRGELIDGTCDYLGHIVLYLTLAFVLQVEIGAAAWWLVVAAGVSHIAQINFYEIQRRQYQYWVHSNAWMRSAASLPEGVLGVFARAHLGLARGHSPLTGRIDLALESAQGNSAELARIRGIVRRHFAQVLPGLNILGSNQRTIVLGLSMLAGSSLYYFVYIAVLLNIALVAFIIYARRSTSSILREISGPTADAPPA